jgi:hypothetical protein
MSHDPGWWKAGFQNATYVFSGMIIACNAISSHFGKQEEPVKEGARAKQREEEQCRLTRIEAGINQLVAQGRLSRPDANRLLQVMLSDQLTMEDKVQVELGKAQPENKPK